MRKVKIELYKNSGKWYETINAETKLPVYEHFKILTELKQEYRKIIEDYDLVVEITDEETGAINKRLIKNNWE